jgi:hypothetical protein
VDHFFLCCDVASDLWSVVFSRFGMPRRVIDLFACWWSAGRPRRAASGCLGLCLDGLSTCLLVGGSLEGLRVLRCEKWCPHTIFFHYLEEDE